MYIMNPEFDDLKRFVNPIYEGEASYRVINEDNEDVTETFIKDTETYHTFKLYGKIRDYISDNKLTLSKDYWFVRIATQVTLYKRITF